MTAAQIDVRDHVALVHWCLRKFGLSKLAERARGLDYDDLVQAGMCGLQRATEKYDPAFGTTFATYATWWVRQSVLRELQNAGSNIRVPVHAQEQRRAAGERTTPGMQSIHDPVRVSADSRVVTLEDRLADPNVADPTSRLEAEQNQVELARLIDRAKLTDRERLVLRRRSEGVPLLEIGAGLGVTRERVRQIELGALLRLRKVAGVQTNAPASLSGAA